MGASRITLDIPESQVVEWVQQLSPTAKHSVLRALLRHLDQLDALVDYGSQRMRALWIGAACPKKSANS